LHIENAILLVSLQFDYLKVIT